MTQEIPQKEESGLDIYFAIEAPPEDETFKKLSASLIDPTTGIIYNPLTNPVPNGDKTLVYQFYCILFV